MENTNFTITNLREGEFVEMILRRHWIVFVYLFGHALVLIISSSVLFVFKEGISAIIGSDIFYGLMFFYWAIFILFLYVQWINNEFDFFVVTNKRIIGVEQLSFLNRTVSECAIENVQEVNAKTSGLLSSIFNFGSLRIHTASEFSDFEMHYSPDALEKARNLLNCISKNKKILLEEIGRKAPSNSL